MTQSNIQYMLTLCELSAPTRIRTPDSEQMRRFKFFMLLLRWGLRGNCGQDNKLTWAHTTRHPSGVRIQVWLWRPVFVPPSRRNSMLAVAKSRP